MDRSRRAVLKASGAALAIGTAGCSRLGQTAGPRDDRIRWAHETEGGVGRLVVTDDRVYALTTWRLFSLSLDGEVEWSQLLDEPDDTIDHDEGLAVDSNHVYVSGSSGTTAYDHEGEQRWHTQDVSTFSGIAVDESGLYIKQRGVVSLEPNTGDVRWRSLTEDVPVWTRPSVHEGVVYVGLDDGRCFALDAEDGSRRWSHDTGVTRSAVPVERDDTVYVGGDDPGTTTGALLALDSSDGTENWRVDTGQVLFGSRPTVTDDTVYVGTGSRHVHAHDRATGDERWSFEVGTEAASLITPPAVGPALYAKESGENLYAIDPETGDEQWNVALGGGVIEPVFAGGSLYAGSYDGIFAIETDSP